MLSLKILCAARVNKCNILETGVDDITLERYFCKMLKNTIFCYKNDRHVMDDSFAFRKKKSMIESTSSILIIVQ